MKKKYSLLFVLIFITFNAFSYYSNADVNFAYHNTTINSDIIDSDSQNIGCNIQWNFFFGEESFIGICANVGYLFNINGSINTEIKELTIDNDINKFSSGFLDTSLGIIFRQHIKNLYFSESVNFNLIVYDGVISDYMDNRDFKLFSVSYAPKISISAYYNFFSTFYGIISASYAYGYSTNTAYISYTEKDQKKTSDYTTKANGTVQDFCIMIGLGFFSF